MSLELVIRDKGTEGFLGRPPRDIVTVHDPKVLLNTLLDGLGGLMGGATELLDHLSESDAFLGNVDELCARIKELALETKESCAERQKKKRDAEVARVKAQLDALERAVGLPDPDLQNFPLEKAEAQAERDLAQVWGRWFEGTCRTRPSNELVGACIAEMVKNAGGTYTTRELAARVMEDGAIHPVLSRGQVQNLTNALKKKGPGIVKGVTCRYIKQKGKNIVAFTYTKPKGKKVKVPCVMSPTDFSKEDNCWKHVEKGEEPVPTEALVDACIAWLKGNAGNGLRFGSADIYEAVTDGTIFSFAKQDALAVAIKDRAGSRERHLAWTSTTSNVPRDWSFYMNATKAVLEAEGKVSA